MRFLLRYAIPATAPAGDYAIRANYAIPVIARAGHYAIPATSAAKTV